MRWLMMCARRVGGAPVPLDEKMPHSVPRQGGGQGQAGRPRPDDQHGHLNHGHLNHGHLNRL